MKYFVSESHMRHSSHHSKSLVIHNAPMQSFSPQPRTFRIRFDERSQFEQKQ